MSAAVIVCTASRERSALLRDCLQSLLAGSRAPDELIVVVDSDSSLATELGESLPPQVRVLVSPRPGLSEARNVGLRAAQSDIVAFLDDDATAEAAWLESLVGAFGLDPSLLGAGGPVLPRWGAARRWLPDELLWVVGCTYSGHRADAGPIRNPIGCNMAFRRREMLELEGFASTFGKRGTALATCEETELALRLSRRHGEGRIRYVPSATVRHYVPANRISFRLLVRRSLSEGLAKGRLHRLYADGALGTERVYLRRLVGEAIPALVVEGIRRRDPERVAAAGAIMSSLAISAAAFLAGQARESRPQADRGPAPLPLGAP